MISFKHKKTQRKFSYAVAKSLIQMVESSMSRNSAVICGPGLGRDEFMLNCCAYVIKSAKDRKIPVIIDGDGLYLLCGSEYYEWDEENRFQNYEYGILTPNAMEFRRLWIRYVLKEDINKYEGSTNTSDNTAKDKNKDKGKEKEKEEYLPPMDTSELVSCIIPMNDSQVEEKSTSKIVDGRCYLCDDFQHLSLIADTALLAKTLGLTILRKGAVDIISDGKYFVVSSTPMMLRRCGGQGDVLAGVVGLWTHWSRQYIKENPEKQLPSVGVLSAFAGSYLLRHFAARAFELKHRSILTTDIIECIPEIMETIFPTNAKL